MAAAFDPRNQCTILAQDESSAQSTCTFMQRAVCRMIDAASACDCPCCLEVLCREASSAATRADSPPGMVDLGDSKTESWAANLVFVALSRATEGSRVAVCGELSLNRVQQMTAGSVVQMVRKEDTRLRSMHEMVRQRQQSEESFESTLRWALHSQPAHPGAGAAQPASSNVPLSTTTSAAGTGRLSQATSLQQSADAATPPMPSTVPGVAWSSAQQHEWLCLRLWQAQQAANALPPNVPPPPPPPPPSV